MSLVFLAALSTIAATADGGAAPFDRQTWLGDYAFLKSELEDRYSNLAWFASPQGGVDLPALDRRTLTALNAAQDDDSARVAILAFADGFHDSHFDPAGPARDGGPIFGRWTPRRQVASKRGRRRSRAEDHSMRRR